MKDENQHLKITSVQCTYYKPGHLRPILMLKPHYSSKCNCGCHFFMHVLVVSDSGTEFVGLSCINCHRSDICFKDEADAALKTGVWADYETFMDKAFLWDSYVGADRKPHFLEFEQQDACTCGSLEFAYYKRTTDCNDMITCCNCGRCIPINNLQLSAVHRSTGKVFDPEERDDWSDNDQKIYDSIPENERYTYGLTHRSVVETFKKLHSKKNEGTPSKMEF